MPRLLDKRLLGLSTDHLDQQLIYATPGYVLQVAADGNSIELAQRGGPTGPTGAIGPTGPTGPAGSNGSNGVSITGPTGPQAVFPSTFGAVNSYAVLSVQGYLNIFYEGQQYSGSNLYTRGSFVGSCAPANYAMSGTWVCMGVIVQWYGGHGGACPTCPVPGTGLFLRIA
jgi:hypothetical protein